MSKTVYFAFLLMAIGGTGASPRTALHDRESELACAVVKDLPLPPADIPTSGENKALANCISGDLYFGLNGPTNPVKARKCAYLEMQRGSNGSVFSGKNILMMAYANGKGAERNLDIAIKLACEMDGDPKDVAGTIHQLERLKAANWKGDNFSICEHSSGRDLYNQCAVLDERFDSRERADRLRSLQEHWTARERRAFGTLKQAADKFFRSHANKEADLQITLEVHEEAFLQKWLLESLEKFEQGELPSPSQDGPTKGDAQVQALFEKTQKVPAPNWGTITPEGIKSTQQLWLAYREAWVNFGKVKYPGVSAESWRAWVDDQRRAMLEKILT